MDGNSWFFGWFFGIVTTTIVFICTSPEPQVKSNKLIQPQKVLTTDGKTVDTLYIYKNETNGN